MERLNADELLAYLDGACTPASALAVEEELSRNPQARVMLLQLQAIRSGLTPALTPSADPAFVRQVVALATEPRPRFRGLTWALLGVLAIAVAGLVALQITAHFDATVPQLHSGLPLYTQELGADLRIHDSAGRSRMLVDGGGLEEGDTLDVAVFNHTARAVFVVVLALDAEDGVQWLYPAEGVPAPSLAAGTLPHPVVSQPLDDVVPGPLKVIAWFSDSPRSSQDADMLLQAGGLESLRHAPGTLALQVVRGEVPEDRDDQAD